MTELELDIKRVRDAIYLLERHGELKFHPGNNGDLGALWIEVKGDDFTVESVRTERFH